MLFATTYSTPHPCTFGFASPCPSTKRRASMAAVLPAPAQPSLLSKLMRAPLAEGLARSQSQRQAHAQHQGNGVDADGDSTHDDDPYWHSDQAGSGLAGLAPAPSLPIPIPEPPVRRCACNARVIALRQQYTGLVLHKGTCDTWRNHATTDYNLLPMHAAASFNGGTNMPALGDPSSVKPHCPMPAAAIQADFWPGV